MTARTALFVIAAAALTATTPAAAKQAKAELGPPGPGPGHRGNPALRAQDRQPRHRRARKPVVARTEPRQPRGDPHDVRPAIGLLHAGQPRPLDAEPGDGERAGRGWRAAARPRRSARGQVKSARIFPRAQHRLDQQEFGRRRRRRGAWRGDRRAVRRLGRQRHRRRRRRHQRQEGRGQCHSDRGQCPRPPRKRPSPKAISASAT